VIRSLATLRHVRTGSKCACRKTLAPAWSAGSARILSPKEWKSGRLTSTRSWSVSEKKTSALRLL
jgi:hypothetical protein